MTMIQLIACIGMIAGLFSKTQHPSSVGADIR